MASWKKMALTAINLVIVAIGACLVCRIFQSRTIYQTANLMKCGMGLWVSGKAIHDDSSGTSFSCAARSG